MAVCNVSVHGQASGQDSSPDQWLGCLAAILAPATSDLAALLLTLNPSFSLLWRAANGWTLRWLRRKPMPRKIQSPTAPPPAIGMVSSQSGTGMSLRCSTVPEVINSLQFRKPDFPFTDGLPQPPNQIPTINIDQHPSSLFPL